MSSFIDAVEQRLRENWAPRDDADECRVREVRQALTEVLAEAGPVAWLYRKYDAEQDVVSHHVLWPGEQQQDDNDPLPVFTAPPADDRDIRRAELGAQCVEACESLKDLLGSPAPLQPAFIIQEAVRRVTKVFEETK